MSLARLVITAVIVEGRGGVLAKRPERRCAHAN